MSENNGFGKGVFFGILITAILVGGFWWYSNNNVKNKPEKKKKKTEKITQEKKQAKDEKKIAAEKEKNQGGGEVKKEDLVLVKEETKGEIYKDTFNGQEFSFSILSGWKANDKIPNKIGLLKTNQEISKNKDGEIVITFKSNKNNLNFDRYYDGLNDVNYFADASGGFNNLKVNGLDAYKFKDVIGYAKSTVVILRTAKGYIEIADLENKYQNGEFEKFVKSFEVK